MCCGHESKRCGRWLWLLGILVILAVPSYKIYRYILAYPDLMLLDEERLYERDMEFFRQRNLKEAQELISSGKDINTRDGAGRTFLDKAARSCSVEAVKLIINSGLELEYTGSNNWSTLHYACVGGSTQIIDMLLQQGLSVTQVASGYLPIEFAVEFGHADAVDLLLKRGHYKKDFIRSLLLLSAENRENIDYWNEKVIEVILQHGAGVHGDFGRQVLVEVFKDHYAMVKTYSPASYRRRLHKDILNAQYEAAKSLLNAGVDVNLSSSIGETPLHIAAKRGRIRLVELFLSHGADKNIKTTENKTARDYAIEAGHKDIAKLLR